MRTINLLLGFGIIIYVGLVVISFFHNGTLIGTIQDISIATISLIVGFIVSGVSRKNNGESNEDKS